MCGRQAAFLLPLTTNHQGASSYVYFGAASTTHKPLHCIALIPTAALMSQHKAIYVADHAACSRTMHTFSRRCSNPHNHLLADLPGRKNSLAQPARSEHKAAQLAVQPQQTLLTCLQSSQRRSIYYVPEEHTMHWYQHWKDRRLRCGPKDMCITWHAIQAR
jgi:hypothetical protein